MKVSAIFYDEKHKVRDTDYVFTNPDIISPNKKAPFEFSFYVDDPEKIKTMAFNVQSDEYSLITDKGQKTIPYFLLSASSQSVMYLWDRLSCLIYGIGKSSDVGNRVVNGSDPIDAYCNSFPFYLNMSRV